MWNVFLTFSVDNHRFSALSKGEIDVGVADCNGFESGKQEGLSSRKGRRRLPC